MSEKRSVPFKSKNELAIELLETYPSSPNEQVYVLVDSWYTSKKLMDACAKKGFHVIGFFRANRMIAPYGMRIKTSTFASKMWTYEGPLSDMENVRVVLFWSSLPTIFLSFSARNGRRDRRSLSVMSFAEYEKTAWVS